MYTVLEPKQLGEDNANIQLKGHTELITQGSSPAREKTTKDAEKDTTHTHTHTHTHKFPTILQTEHIHNTHAHGHTCTPFF